MFTDEIIADLQQLHLDAACNAQRIASMAAENHGELSSGLHVALVRNAVIANATASALMCAQAGISLSEARELLVPAALHEREPLDMDAELRKLLEGEQ